MFFSGQISVCRSPGLKTNLVILSAYHSGIDQIVHVQHSNWLMRFI